MTIKDQDHFNPDEPRPKWVETKNIFRYQIFKDHIRFLFEDKELPVPIEDLKRILSSSDFYLRNGYYTGQCIDCHLFDGLVKGYCKKCFDKNEMEYDKGVSD